MSALASCLIPSRNFIVPPFVSITRKLTSSASERPNCLLQPLTLFSAADRRRILAHLLALSPDDRLLRFSHAIRDEGIAAYVEQLDFEGEYIAGLCNESKQIIALAHAGVNNAELDFGLSVSAAWRDHGLGRRLFTHVIALARRMGAKSIVCHSISPAVLHMATSCGFSRPGSSFDAPLSLTLQP